MRRLALYSFVITLVWLTFIVAISFVEAPAKFQALKIERFDIVTPALKHALEIGHVVFHRLNRIEGQIRGIRGMVEKDIYCADILVQVAAVNSALNGFSKELLAQHVRTCVADDLRAGSEEKLDELIKLLPKLMK